MAKTKAISDTQLNYLINKLKEGLSGKANTTDLNNTNTKVNSSINNLSVSGTTVTFTKNDGTTDTITTQDTVYTHPTYTKRTGVPTANQNPDFGGTFTVSQPVSDTTGHITAINSRTITVPGNVATESAKGLMDSTDKAKLNKITNNGIYVSDTEPANAAVGAIWVDTSTEFIPNAEEVGF